MAITAHKVVVELLMDDDVVVSPMTLTLNIPDEFSNALAAKMGNPARAALEALGAEAYRLEVLSLEQVRQLLCLESRWEAQRILSERGVWPGQSADEILHDADVASAFRQAHA